MRIEAPFLDDPRTQAVLRALTQAGAEAFVVGGAVRNALIGVPVDDIDIATSALPDRVVDIARAAGFAAHPTGIEHGTITVVVEGASYEVTTYRRDVETDGRHATVAFADRVEEDAERRDFTMNALYVAADGEVTDPIGGLPDLEARRVRFIGQAEERIREDYLRILRFFRFHARFGQGAPDADGLAACAALVEGLDTLSAERITMETAKLLGTTSPYATLTVMGEAGVLARVLEGASLKLMPALARAEAGFAPDWRRRLLALGGARGRFRLSKAQAAYFRQAEAALVSPQSVALRAHLYGFDLARDVAMIEAAILQISPPEDLLAELEAGCAAQFPLVAADLMPPHAPGPLLGAELARLKEIWRAGRFAPDRAALLDQMRPPDGA